MATPTVYTSRSRTNRRRLLLVAAVVMLVLVGTVIGRLVSGGPAAGSSPLAQPPSSAASSSEASAEPSAPSVAPTTTAPIGVDAYQPLQAENAAALTGIDKQDTEDLGGGQNVGWIANGDWLRFDGIDFGGTAATQFIARLASDVGDGVNGRVEIRLDDQGSAPVGTLPVKRTGGWQTWITQATDVTGVTGVHTVFLTFAADRGDEFVNLNYVKFGH